VRFAYTLTPKGKDMGEILIAIVRWGRKHIPGTVALAIATRETATAKSATTRKRARRA